MVIMLKKGSVLGFMEKAVKNDRNGRRKLLVSVICE